MRSEKEVRKMLEIAEAGKFGLAILGIDSSYADIDIHRLKWFLNDKEVER